MKLGSIRGSIAVVPSSWTPKVDDYPKLLQWGHSTCAIRDRYGGRWYSHEQTEDEAYNLIEEMAFKISNGPLKEVNPRGLEVSLRLMH